jgi:hypothetical protein
LAKKRRHAVVGDVCAFCSKPGSSQEHVFAKWIAEELRDKSPAGHRRFNLERRYARGKQSTRYMALYSRAACRECNETWMSDFENTAKPLLIPLLHDRPTRWDSRLEKTLVARWAYKTALISTRTNRPQYWTVPTEDFRYLYEHRKPPLSVTILLGRYIEAPGEVFRPAWHGSSWFEGKIDSGLEFHGYRVTFSVGHAIFQVWGRFGTDSDPQVAIPEFINEGVPIEDVLRRLWPPANEPHEWPPRGGQFTTSGLERLEPPPS